MLVFGELASPCRKQRGWKICTTFALLSLAVPSSSCIVIIMPTLNHSPVSSDPGVMGGTLVFKGTRVPASALCEYLDGGDTLDGFFDDFPAVNREDALEFLKIAREENYPG